jgi:preprotein translocase subunit YajC
MKQKLSRILTMLSAAALFCLTLAGCAPTTAGTAEGGTAAGGGYTSIIMIVVLIAVFYFFMIRPESKKKKKAEEMRNSLGVGDKITTIGGMVGKIVDISGDLITFETGEDRVRIQVTKWAISANGIEKSSEDK